MRSPTPNSNKARNKKLSVKQIWNFWYFVQTFKDSWQIAPLLQWSVKCSTHCMRYNSLPRKSPRNLHKLLCNVWNFCSRQKYRWSVAEKSDGFRNRKWSSRTCHTHATLSQLSVLFHCSVMIPKLLKIITSQFNNSTIQFNSVFQSTKEV
jgi:hypothetical protein